MAELDTTDWPQGLVDIAAIVGAEATLRLVDRFGGVEKFYIPKLDNRVGLAHPWAEILGEGPWRALCKAFGGQRINLPNCTYAKLKKRVILELAEDKSLSHRQIALRARATETYVRMVLRGLDTSVKQLDLFSSRRF
jgi:hypothetical protein